VLTAQKEKLEMEKVDNYKMNLVNKRLSKRVYGGLVLLAAHQEHGIHMDKHLKVQRRER
jgi:ABC-type transport system involved in cytochrome c biogenesis ATPase subunit